MSQSSFLHRELWIKRNWNWGKKVRENKASTSNLFTDILCPLKVKQEKKWSIYKALTEIQNVFTSFLRQMLLLLSEALFFGLCALLFACITLCQGFSENTVNLRNALAADAKNTPWLDRLFIFYCLLKAF